MSPHDEYDAPFIKVTKSKGLGRVTGLLTQSRLDPVSMLQINLRARLTLRSTDIGLLTDPEY